MGRTRLQYKVIPEAERHFWHPFDPKGALAGTQRWLEYNYPQEAAFTADQAFIKFNAHQREVDRDTPTKWLKGNSFSSRISILYKYGILARRRYVGEIHSAMHRDLQESYPWEFAPKPQEIEPAQAPAEQATGEQPTGESHEIPGEYILRFFSLEKRAKAGTLNPQDQEEWDNACKGIYPERYQ